MTPEKWAEISKIFHAAAEIEPDRRHSFISEACGGDESVIREVESLLTANGETGNFILEPAIKLDPAGAENGDAFQPGGMIGHYRIERNIGSGGMGDVFLATDTRLNRSIAIKTLPVSYSLDPNFLKRFRNEARAAATLNHPNVATIYSVEDHEGRPFITMEYVEGKTLDQVTPASGLDLRQFLDWFVQIADAVRHAHESGITHRDIKPGNIMISAAGRPKILDFGLAQITADSRAFIDSMGDITEPGQIVGTPSYMSPEQATGADADYRSDIFSLGVVMYEAITGVKPFAGSSNAEIVSNVLKADPSPPSSIRPEVPFLLDRLIARCLEKRRADRYQNMQEAVTILAESKAVMDAAASTGSSLRRLYREAHSSSPLWIFGAALLVIVLAVAGWLYFAPRGSEPPFKLSEINIRRLSQTNDVVFAQITPDGNSIAYNTISNVDNRSLWIRRIGDRNALQLVPPQPVEYWGGLAVSHDNSFIYYITAERGAGHGTLYRISTLGGAPRKLVEKVNDLGSLSPDGKRVLFVRYGDRMQLLSTDAVDGSGESVIAEGAEGVIFRDPQYAPDGRSVYYIRRELSGGAETWTVVRSPLNGSQQSVAVPEQKERISEILPLNDGRGMILNAVDPASNLHQLFYLSLTDGSRTRITNDLNSYFGISIDAANKTLVTAQRYHANDLWVGDPARPESFKKLTTEANIYLNVAWTPDGRLVYDAVEHNRPRIWIANSDGGDAQQLTGSGSSDHDPRVSPDGRYIVFTSDRSGENQVWRMNIDGSSPIMLSVGEGTGTAPLITPDGKSVYFMRAKGSSFVLAKVSIDGGEIAEIPPFSRGLWSISPDGRRVAYVLANEGEGRTKVGIQELGAESPSAILDISPVLILSWSQDGSGLFYRERSSEGDPYGSIWFRSLKQPEPRLFLSVSPDTAIDMAIGPDRRTAAVIRGRLFTDAVMISRSAGEEVDTN